MIRKTKKSLSGNEKKLANNQNSVYISNLKILVECGRKITSGILIREKGFISHESVVILIKSILFSMLNINDV